MNQPEINPFNENSEEFDRALDNALATYTPVEPPPGIERRVLNNLAANLNFRETRVRSGAFRSGSFGNGVFGQWWVAWASTAVALGVVLGIWTYMHREGPSTPSARIASVTQALPYEAVARRPAGSSAGKLAKGELRRISMPPRLRPSSHPQARVDETNPLQPNQQERLLEQLITNGSAKALVMPSRGDPLIAVSSRGTEDEPIQIQPLSTQPISIAPIRIAALQPISNPAE